jgi:hypothetical protein
MQCIVNHIEEARRVTSLLQLPGRAKTSQKCWEVGYYTMRKPTMLPIVLFTLISTAQKCLVRYEENKKIHAASVKEKNKGFSSSLFLIWNNLWI